MRKRRPIEDIEQNIAVCPNSECKEQLEGLEDKCRKCGQTFEHEGAD
jgi:hypothetical protein